MLTAPKRTRLVARTAHERKLLDNYRRLDFYGRVLLERIATLLTERSKKEGHQP
jgi:hypothetical protein